MIDNGTSIKRDEKLVTKFLEILYPSIKDNPAIDVLLNNTDFGVG